MHRFAARLVLVLLFAALFLAALLLLYPVRNGIIRPVLVASLLALSLLVLVRLWKNRYLRRAVIILAALALAATLLPGRPSDPAALRSAYLRALRRYEGTRYVWGAETRLGVDCSGLIRAAMIDAELGESLRTANPALLRESLWLWWNDTAARDMPHGYHGRMITLSHTRFLRDSDPSIFQPGDLAISADGAHVLAFLGTNQWIEADPNALRVIILPHDAPSAWLAMPMTIVRWRCLQDPIAP